MPWENKLKYGDLYEYYRQMIQIRRQHKGFRLGTAELVQKHVEFLPTDNEALIIYRIKDLDGIDTAKSLVVLLNGSAAPAEAVIPEGDYTVLAEDAKADAAGIATIHATNITVAPYSATILAE